MSQTHENSRPIPAFAPARGGDDLDEARRFIEQSVAGMRNLRIDDAPATEAWLDGVDLFARPLQARAILRAVARARTAETTEQLGRDLTTVGSLIAQYEQGLVDVEAQLEAGEVFVEENAFDIVPPALTGSAEARFEEARATLAGLLPIVDTHGHFDALESLVAFRPTVPKAAPVITPMTAASHRIDVEAFLPGLADHAQRMARLHGKPVTVSYASDNALLPVDLTAEWQAAVETALTAIAEATLEAPAARRARGLALTAHIGMTATGTEQGVTLCITCPGHTPPRMVVDAPHSLEARMDDGTLTLVFTASDEALREGAA